MKFDRILVIVARYVHTVSLNIIIMTIRCSTQKMLILLGLLHININLDSTSIIITGHKIVGRFFLRRILLSVSILGAIFMHTSIFSA